jgi:hypothetical protein
MLPAVIAAAPSRGRAHQCLRRRRIRMLRRVGRARRTTVNAASGVGRWCRRRQPLLGRVVDGRQWYAARAGSGYRRRSARGRYCGRGRSCSAPVRDTALLVRLEPIGFRTLKKAARHAADIPDTVKKILAGESFPKKQSKSIVGKECG